MPDENKEMEKLLVQLAERIREGRNETDAATPRDIATALAAVREQWFEREKARLANKQTQHSSPANSDQTQTLAESPSESIEAEQERRSEDWSSGQKSSSQQQSEDHDQDHGHSH